MREGRIDGVTLLDFGVARGLQHTRALTRTGITVGTPAYMAPEQARGQSELSPSVDIFALGCVLFECLSGRAAFVGEYLEAILVKILFEPVPSVRALCSDIPESVDRLLMRMLCKDPVERIPDAAALLKALSAIEAGSQRDLTPTSVAALRMLSGAEQQLVSVVLGRVENPTGQDVTLRDTDERHRIRRLASLRHLLQEMEVRSELLADGTLVATITGELETAATDQAQRAALCALLLRERFPTAQVALATGRALLDGQWPIGEAISRAVRLLHTHAQVPGDSSTQPVIIDSVTAGLLDSRFRLQPLSGGAVALLGEQGGDESRPLLGRPTICVGRDAELTMLCSALDASIDEQTAQVVVVLGQAGAGKSRLRHEFLRKVAAREDKVLVLQTRGDLMSTGTPFHILRQGLQRLYDVQLREDGDTQRNKLHAHIASVLGPHESTEVISRTAAFLGELCGLPVSDAPGEALRAALQQPRLMEEGIRRAFITWLRAECNAQPVLLVVEDLRWADLASVKLIDAALRELEDASFCVLGLSRPEGIERFPKLWPESAQTVPLRPLGKKAREQLVRYVLGKATSAAVLTRIVEQSAGNPLYLEELIRATVEGKGEEPPPTILAMLQARIGRLESRERRVLRAASVFGEQCGSAGVSSLLGIEAVEATRWLDLLSSHEFLDQKSQSRAAPEQEYHFRHAMTREAAYSLLSDEDRKLAHGLAGKYLEGVNEAPAVLAYHFDEAGNSARALHYYEKAGDEAARMAVLEDARKHYAAAVAKFNATADGDEQGHYIDLLLKQVAAGLMVESAEVQLPRLNDARMRLQSVIGGAEVDQEDGLRLARADYYHARVLYYNNHPREALVYHQRVHAVANQLNDRNLRVLNTFSVGRAYILAGRFGEACRLFAEVLEPMGELGDLGEWSRCFTFYAMALAGAGRYLEARAQIERGLGIVTQTKQAPLIALFHVTSFGVYLHAGDWPLVKSTADDVMQMAAPLGDKTLNYMSLDSLAWAESHLGHFDDALAHRAKAVELRQTVSGGICRDWYEAGEAEILLMVGRFEDALRQAQTVAALSQREDLPFSQAVAERIWGCSLFRLGADLGEILTHLDLALQISLTHEQRVNHALTEVAFGKVLRKHRGVHAAEPHFASAIAILEAAGCEFALNSARRSATDLTEDR